MPFKSVAVLSKEIKELDKRISDIEERLNVPDLLEPRTQISETPAIPEVKPVEPIGTPIPSEYRKVVNEVLNQNFEIEIEYRKDSPEFVFTIIVPDKYSSLTPSEREMIHQDRRPKVVNNGLGFQGVKDYTNLVFTSFGPTMQSLIVADRINS